MKRGYDDNGDDSEYDERDKRDRYNRYDKRIKSLSYMNDPYADKIYTAGKRELHFTAHVDDDTITRLKKLIAEIVNEDKHLLVKFDKDGKPERKENDIEITYIVDSPGGSVSSVLNFVDYMNFLRSKYANLKFTSIATGTIASAGTVMCIIADKRKMTCHALAMIHELSSGLGRSSYSKILANADCCKKLHTFLTNIYQESRGIDVKNVAEMQKLEEMLKNESWMTADEYKLLGFIDDIIPSTIRK